MTKTALVTGCTGQDGAYLTDLLIGKGYSVLGTVRRSASFNPWRLAELGILDKTELVRMDLTDPSNIRDVLNKYKPDEIYALAAQSDVGISFIEPFHTTQTNYLGQLALFEAVLKECPKAKVYNAASSEMFGNSAPPQSEITPMCPDSPYAIAKLASYHAARHYRKRGLFICNGILFNHESPLRGAHFVTRKITISAAQIFYNRQSKLRLGRTDTKRDWSHSKDAVKAMWLMMQQKDPDDFVIGSGETHSVMNFARLAFETAGLQIEHHLVPGDPEFLRPVDVEVLHSHPLKAREKLDWNPKYSFEALVLEMVRKDLERARNGEFTGAMKF